MVDSFSKRISSITRWKDDRPSQGQPAPSCRRIIPCYRGIHMLSVPRSYAIRVLLRVRATQTILRARIVNSIRLACVYIRASAPPESYTILESCLRIFQDRICEIAALCFEKRLQKRSIDRREIFRNSFLAVFAFYSRLNDITCMLVSMTRNGILKNSDRNLKNSSFSKKYFSLKAARKGMRWGTRRITILGELCIARG